MEIQFRPVLKKMKMLKKQKKKKIDFHAVNTCYINVIRERF